VVIEELDFRPHNLAKLRAHGITQREVRELVDLDDYTVGTHEDYPNQVRITGYTSASRFLTIVLENLGGGVYRPITGWVATRGERARYGREAEGSTRR
jgi:hypothetical protein